MADVPLVFVPEKCHLLGILPWQAAAFRSHARGLKILVPAESQRDQAACRAGCGRCPSSAHTARTLRSVEPTADGFGWVRVYPQLPFAGPSEGPSTAQRFGLDNGRGIGPVPDPCTPRRLGEICYWFTQQRPTVYWPNRSLGSAAGPSLQRAGCWVRSTAMHRSRVAGGSVCNFVWMDS